VVAVFAREVTDDLTSLVKQIDEIVGKNEDKKMASFLVVLAEDADAVAPKLEAIADKQKITNTPLTIFDGVAGPASYKIAKDADVTVLMWKGLDVKVNVALGKGELNAASIKKIVANTADILKDSGDAPKDKKPKVKAKVEAKTDK
jgi:hypothetical protein